MASPLRLLPTAVIVALATAKAQKSVRERLVEYLTKRDGAFKMLFQRYGSSDPATAYPITFSELVNGAGLSLDELLDAKLVTSWMDCVALKITLDDVIPSRDADDAARLARCNGRLLKKAFGETFVQNIGKEPLKLGKGRFLQVYAQRLTYDDFVTLQLNAKILGQWLLEKAPQMTETERRSLGAVLRTGKREDWITLGFTQYDQLLLQSKD